MFLNEYQSIWSTHHDCQSIWHFHSKANNLVFLNEYQSIWLTHLSCQSIRIPIWKPIILYSLTNSEQLNKMLHVFNNNKKANFGIKYFEK